MLGCAILTVQSFSDGGPEIEPDPQTTFPGPPVDGIPALGERTLGGLLRAAAALHGPREAIVFDDPLRGGSTTRWTYDDLWARARAVARSLIATDVEIGDRVAIVMGNRPEHIASIFGTAMVGAVAVPVSTFAPPAELAAMLSLAEVRCALTQRKLLDRYVGADLRALRDQVEGLHDVWAVGEEAWEYFLQLGTDVSDGELERRSRKVGEEDPALVIFSSGTTSAPKGILHAHRAPAQQMWVQAEVFGRGTGTRMWTALPLFWTAGLNTAVGSTFAAGGCWVAQETFDPAEALALMERERVTEPYCLPHQTAALAEHPDWEGTDLSSLRCVYGKGAFARHPSVDGDPGWIMPVGYGLSETCAFVFSHWSTATREQTRRSMGHLMPGTELRVVDVDTGEPLGVGETGELAVRGSTLMLRYLGKTPGECFDADGFFRTGDAGHVDELGEVHFDGRRTEMIKTGGANVSPAELEVQLRACAPVKLSRVIGMPDERLDQIVVACVTLADGAEATEADIKAFLKERVSSYKVPKHVFFFADGEIPMTTGATKVRDDELRSLVASRMAPATAPPSIGTT